MLKLVSLIFLFPVFFPAIHIEFFFGVSYNESMETENLSAFPERTTKKEDVK